MWNIEQETTVIMMFIKFLHLKFEQHPLCNYLSIKCKINTLHKYLGIL